MQGEQLVSLHLVEGPADVQAAVVQLLGQSVHEDVEGLGTGRMQTAREEEAGDALAQRAGCLPPLVVTQALALGGHLVEHVEAEHQLGLEQQQHLLLVEGDEVAGRKGAEGGGVALVHAEEAAGLYDVGGADLLDDTAGVVVALGLGLQGAADEEDKVGAGVTLAYEALAGHQLGEAKLGVARHLHEVGVAHALEQGKLQQPVVNLHTLYSCIFSFIEGEYQTRFWPWSS